MDANPSPFLRGEYFHLWISDHVLFAGICMYGFKNTCLLTGMLYCKPFGLSSKSQSIYIQADLGPME